MIFFQFLLNVEYVTIDVICLIKRHMHNMARRKRHISKSIKSNSSDRRKGKDENMEENMEENMDENMDKNNDIQHHVPKVFMPIDDVLEFLRNNPY